MEQWIWSELLESVWFLNLEPEVNSETAVSNMLISFLISNHNSFYYVALWIPLVWISLEFHFVIVKYIMDFKKVSLNNNYIN